MERVLTTLISHPDTASTSASLLIVLHVYHCTNQCRTLYLQRGVCGSVPQHLTRLLVTTRLRHAHSDVKHHVTRSVITKFCPILSCTKKKCKVYSCRERSSKLYRRKMMFRPSLLTVRSLAGSAPAQPVDSLHELSNAYNNRNIYSAHNTNN